MFPAASAALMVTEFVPTNRGIAGTDQFAVPLATPASPFDVLQITAVTPMLSFAVPLKATVDSVVTALVVAGELIVRLGAVVSGPGFTGVAGGGVDAGV